MKDIPHWMELCQQASVEQYLEKLMELVKEINRLLEEKERAAENRAIKEGLLAYLARAKRYGDRCLFAFLLRR
jgi:hypothetical protein